ncbi:MAG: glycosyltransferase, partial [Promethearchaeota archaeon]
MKNILVLPSWYPTNYNPILGIYFKEQVEALNEFNDLQMNVLHVKYLGINRLKEAFNTDAGNEGVSNGINYLSHVYINLFPKIKFFKDKVFKYKIKKYYEKIVEKIGKPDLLHAHISFPAGYQAFLLSKEFNIPFIVTEHATFFEIELLKRFKHYTLDVLQNADYYVAVSSFLRDKINKAGRKQCDVLPNFIDVGKFELAKNNNRFDNNVFNFINIADLSYKKGFDILLNAFRKVIFEYKYPNVHLHLIGTGEKEAEFRQLTDQLSLIQYCTYHGRLEYERIPEYLNSSNA